ncbi:MAG: FAD-dependent thymidylate synthase [Dehalococcoidia bacterium]
MKVALLNSTPDPGCIVAAAARLVTSKINSGKLREKLTSERSCAASRQLASHRFASYTQQSQRYVSFTQIRYIIPATSVNKGFTTKFHEMAKAGCDEHQSCGLFPTREKKVGG